MAVYDLYGNSIGGGGGSSSGGDYKSIEGVIASNYNGPVKRPYWILHIDCGRKFFSVANLKTIINTMQTNGLNQLQLHFSDARACRFELDDMTVVTDDGVSYDISQITSTAGEYKLSQSDMDEIIVYANSKGIEVVPSLDMPGHMTCILDKFPQFKYRMPWTLDCTNETAVKFALAIISKYAEYFSLRGCKYWNIGADEAGNNGTSSGRWGYFTEEEIPYFIEFINKAAGVVASHGMVPRVFNDPVLYGEDYSIYFNRNIEVYYWCSNGLLLDTKITPSDTLRKAGFKLINTNESWYHIIPGDNSETHPEIEVNSLLKAMKDATLAYDQDGACICVWCDSDFTNDGGTAALPGIIDYIESFGVGIGLTLANIDYPIIQ